jgi:ribosomal protein S17E
MGKIKTRLIKRTAKALTEKGIEFNEDFKKNKGILGSEMPSKKVRNQIAGFLSRQKKKERIEKQKTEESIAASKK